ncbi:MAG: HEPN domain-containing protein [Thermodesulfobacteriota bacterium]|nr:HEPN domain-containing protein [Thermodesulfobacteriota bacterium]
MIIYRLDFAKKYLEDAIELFNKKRFNSSASRAYYASYQAMWAALGDPEEGKIWRHLAIIKHFVRGYWFAPNYPKIGPGLLEDKRLPLRRLYAYRIKSDYDVIDIDQHNLEQLLKVVKQVINIIVEKGGR